MKYESEDDDEAYDDQNMERLAVGVMPTVTDEKVRLGIALSLEVKAIRGGADRSANQRC